MGSKGSNTTTQSQTNAPNPAAMAAYNAILDRAMGVANTPYQAYGGELTAGINQQQQAGVSGINQNAGFASPFISEAAGFARQGAAPISAADIARYQDPYTQQVVNATQAQFNNQNAQQQSVLLGNAAAKGALGGDRVGVAQANLSGQQSLAQSPIIAGLYSQGYGQALSAAQRQQQQATQSAGMMGNLGVAGQQAGLAGSQAMLGAGTMQQQTEQDRLNALYQQYQIQQAFPYQQTQWLAGVGTGVGSQMGGTSTGTSTQPGPNPWSQALGLGLTAAGAFFGGPAGASAGATASKAFLSARGGRVAGFAEGGAPVMPYGGAAGFIPMVGLSPGRGAPGLAPMPGGNEQGQKTDYNKLGTAAGDLAGKAWDKWNQPLDLTSGLGASGQMGDVIPISWGPTAGMSGIYARGGAVWEPGGYDDGGPILAGFEPVNFADRFAAADRSPVAGVGPMTFAERAAPVDEAVRSGTFDPQGANYAAYEAPRAPATVSDAGVIPVPRQRPELLPAPEPVMAAEQPPPAPVGGFAPQPVASESPQRERGFGLGFLSPAAQQGLMAAGLGMMASRSPHLGSAIGEGGLAGLQAYSGARQRESAAEEKRVSQAQQERRINLEAERLTQAAKEASERIGISRETLSEARRRHKWEEEEKPIALQGTLVKPSGEVILEGSGMSDEALEIGARQLAGGDLSPLTNVGRGAQGARKITALRNRAAEILVKEKGMSTEDAATHMSRQVQRFKARSSGLMQEERTAGGRRANLDIILKATEAAVPAALEASEAVARTGWVPINQIIQRGQVIASNPELREFGMANLQLAEHWARAMNPTGVMRESDRDMALNFLSTADSKETYKRAVMQLQKQIKRERAAVDEEKAGGHGGPSSTAPAAPPAAAEREKNKVYQTPKGPKKWTGSGWVEP